MRIDVITLFPRMFDGLQEYGVVGRAIQRNQLQLGLWNPRDYAENAYGTVDDRPYGGGPGMVMMVKPLRAAIQAAKANSGEPRKVIYLSPQGRKLDQLGLAYLAQQPGLILVSGRYEGIDERLVESEIDEEWSVGDYVLSGGELAAMTIIDGTARLLPGVLGHEDSAEQDSFSNGLLDCPHYTRPEEVDGMRVPSVLTSGDHQAIARWRMKQSLGRTWQRRPDLLQGLQLTNEQQRLLDEFIQETQKLAKD